MPNCAKFHDLEYDILKVATGTTFQPDQLRLEAIINWLSFDIRCRVYYVKFLFKCFFSNDPENDILHHSIRSLHSYGNSQFMNCQLDLLRHFIYHKNGGSRNTMTASRNLNLSIVPHHMYTEADFINYRKEGYFS